MTSGLLGAGIGLFGGLANEAVAYLKDKQEHKQDIEMRKADLEAQVQLAKIESETAHAAAQMAATEADNRRASAQYVQEMKLEESSINLAVQQSSDSVKAFSAAHKSDTKSGEGVSQSVRNIRGLRRDILVWIIGAIMLFCAVFVFLGYADTKDVNSASYIFITKMAYIMTEMAIAMITFLFPRVVRKNQKDAESV